MKKKLKLFAILGLAGLVITPMVLTTTLTACSNNNSSIREYLNGWDSSNVELQKKGFVVESILDKKNNLLKLNLDKKQWLGMNKFLSADEIETKVFNKKDSIVEVLKGFLLNQSGDVTLTINDVPDSRTETDILYSLNVSIPNKDAIHLFFKIEGFGNEFSGELVDLDVSWDKGKLDSNFEANDDVLHLNLSSFADNNWFNLNKYSSISDVALVVENNWSNIEESLKMFLTDTDNITLEYSKYLLPDENNQSSKNVIGFALKAKKIFTNPHELFFVIDGFGNDKPIDPSFNASDYLKYMIDNAFIYDENPMRNFLKRNVSNSNNLGLDLAQFVMNLNSKTNSGYDIDYIFNLLNNVAFKNVDKAKFKKVVKFVQFKVLDFSNSFFRMEIDYNFDLLFWQFNKENHNRRTVEYHIDITDWKNDIKLKELPDTLNDGWDVVDAKYLKNQSVAVTTTIPNVDIFNTKNIDDEKSKIQSNFDNEMTNIYGRFWSSDMLFQETLLQGLLFLKSNFHNEIDNIKIYEKQDMFLFTGIINKNNVVKNKYINNFSQNFKSHTFSKNDEVYLILKRKKGPTSNPTFSKFQQGYEHLDNNGKKIIFENIPIFKYADITQIQFMDEVVDLQNKQLEIPLMNYWYDYQEVKNDSTWLDNSIKNNFEFNNQMLPLRRYALGTHNDFGLGGALNLSQAYYSRSDDDSNRDKIKDANIDSTYESQRYVRYLIQQNYGHIMDKMVLYTTKDASDNITITAQVKIKTAGKVIHKFQFVNELKTRIFTYQPNDIVKITFSFQNKKIIPSGVSVENPEFNLIKSNLNNFWDYADYDVFRNYKSKDRVTPTQFVNLQPVSNFNWQVYRKNKIENEILTNWSANNFNSVSISKMFNFVYYV